METIFNFFYLLAAMLAGFILPELLFIHGGASTGKISKVPTGINLVTAFVFISLVTYILRK